MLQFKLKALLHSKGIIYPHAWLMKNCNFTPTKATKLLSGKQKSINRQDLSFICGVLQCTPNDILYWENTPRHTLEDNHPLLQELSPPPRIQDWKKLLRNISPEKAAELYALAVKELGD